MARSRGLLGAISTSPSAVSAILARTAPFRRSSAQRFCVDRSGRFVEASKENASAVIGSFAICVDGSNAPRASMHPLAWVAGNVIGAGGDPPLASPVQTVLDAYARSTARCFGRLQGNFCAAIYDPALRGLRIARDLAGSKPLFYAVASGNPDGQCVVFGSSAVEVLCAAGLPRVAHPALLHRYLLEGALAGPSETLLQGVLALRRGHYLELIPATLPLVREIEFPVDSDGTTESASLDERADELRTLLLRTVEAQSATGNITVALSGGIDSSGILACLRRTRHQGDPLHVFSYLPGSPAVPEAWNERPWVQGVAERLNATLHSVELDASEVPARLESLAPTQDFPFGSPVVLAQDKLFRVAAESGVEAIFSGHGPDILFGGGDSHLAARISELLRAGRVVAATRMLLGASEYAEHGRYLLLRAAIRRALSIEIPRAWQARRIPWANNDWFRDRQSNDGMRSATSSTPHLESMRALISEQLSSSAGSTALLYEDRNAASSGLENRMPYLVAASVRLSRNCRPEHLVSDRGETKHVLRRALTGLLPDEILYRRKRIGFAVPALPWLLQQREWVEQRFRELRGLPFFRGVPVKEVWEELDSGTPAAWPSAFRLWRWLVLLEWARAHDVKFH